MENPLALDHQKAILYMKMNSQSVKASIIYLVPVGVCLEAEFLDAIHGRSTPAFVEVYREA